MRKLHLSFVASSFALLLAVGSASGAFHVANLVDGINPLPIDGNQAWTGQLGDDLTVGSKPLLVTDIAVFDSNGDGSPLGNVFTWSLYEVTTGNLVQQFPVVVAGPRVPAGNTVLDNYFIVPVTPFLISANTAYSVVAHGFNAQNENFNTNFNLNTLDVVFSNIGFTGAGGRYSAEGNLVGLPSFDVGNVVSNKAYNFGAASFLYTVVPEPGTMMIWALIGIGIVSVRRFGFELNS